MNDNPSSAMPAAPDSGPGAAHFVSRPAFRLVSTCGALLLCSALALAGMLFFLASHGRPLLGGDAPCFVPTAVNWVRTGEFANPLYCNAWAYDSRARFVYYPPLFPMLLAFVLKTFSWTDIPHLGVAFLSCGALAAATMSAHYLIRDCSTAHQGDLRLLPALFACSFLTVFAVFAMLLSVWGRPEAPAIALLAVVGSLLARRERARNCSWTALPAGLAIGAAASAQLVLGAKALTLAMILFYAPDVATWTKRMVAASLSALLSFVVITIVLNPISTEDLVSGIRAHATAVTYTAPHLWHYLLCGVQLNLPAWYPLYLATILSVVTALAPAFRGGPTRSCVAVALVASYVLLEWKFTILQPPAMYNSSALLAMTIPVMISTTCRLRNPIVRQRLLWATATSLAVIASGSFRVTYLAFQGLRQTPSIEEARTCIDAFVREGTLGVTEGIWPLLTSYEHARLTQGRTIVSGGPLPYDRLIIQQFNHSNITTVAGYEEITQLGLGGRILLLGNVPISNSPMGYQFRLFKRLAPTSGNGEFATGDEHPAVCGPVYGAEPAALP